MTTLTAPPAASGQQLLDAFCEMGRSLEIGRTAETVLAGVPAVLPAADRASLTVLALDGATVVCRRARGRDEDAAAPCEPGEPVAPPAGAPPAGPETGPEAGPQIGLLRRVLDSGRAEQLRAPAEIAADSDLAAGTASAVAAPVLGAGGRRLGVLLVESRAPEAFDRESRQALRAYAAGAATAIERTLFYEKAVEGHRLVSELEVAGKVLHGLLPHHLPRLEGLEAAAVYEPCSSVGGDYYDFVPLGEDRWGIAVGDVAGKGLPAALLVAALRASIFSLAHSSLALRAILARTNRLLYESVGETRYATLFYGVLDVPLRRIVYINAGHAPPILVRANGAVEMIHAGGLPVGLFPAPRYFEQDLQLGAGDLLALYTDGITESADRSGDLFGRDRLADLLRRERDRGTPAAEISDLILKTARRFRGGAPDDDSTAVLLRAR